MKATSSIIGPATSKSYRAILLGGLICGIMDITAAFIVYGLLGSSPILILQSIASGLLGMDAYDGNFATAGLGAGLHFLIALTAAAIYHLASRKLQFLIQHPVSCGLLYGIAVYLFMNFIVLPLSAFPHKVTYSSGILIRGFVIHMFCVGLPISLANSWYSSSRNNETS